MKKFALVLLGLLWILAGVQLLADKDAKEEQRIVEVFGKVGNVSQSSVVEYYGTCKGDALSDKEGEELLREVAGGLGLTQEGMEVIKKSESGRHEIKLYKETAKAASSLRFITVEDKKGSRQYIIVNLAMDADMDSALAYRRKLEDIMEDHVKDSRSSANVIGAYKGRLTLEERNNVADGLLAEMGARIVTENRDMNLYTIYGYSPYISDYEIQDGEAVNINIAMYYNELEDTTYLYAAVPLVGLDY